MKRNLLRNTLVTGALCSVLLVPSFAQEATPTAISAMDSQIVPISYPFNHWAETYREQLLGSYNAEAIFQGKDLDATISSEDFKSLVKIILDEKYDGAPDTMTREAVVHEMAKIWASKTNQELDEIATIKMLIYADTSAIDPQYNHSITVAYMKNIAIGKGEGLFDPKADVTYGELATLINNTDKAIKNTMEKPIMEGKYETRGSYKTEEDKVVFDFELMSHYTETQRLQFSSGQQFEIIITDEEDKEVYRYSNGRLFTLALVMKEIGPGETFKWQDVWDMTNKEGEKLTSGKYKAEIKILVMDEEDNKVEQDQLTTILEFSLE